MSTAPTRPIAVDLFAGAGGMSLGLEQAGFDVVAALEYDPVHAATHAFNFPHCATLCRSICEVSADEIRDRAGLGGRGVDVVAGGPPCQGFSLIGKRAVEDVRNRLVFEFHRLVVELEATYFVMENVPGMNVGKHGGLLDELVRTFRASGYHSRPIALLTATEFGVPQGRTRLFLVGALDGCSLPAPPQETTSPTGLLLPRTPTVWDAIGDLPDVDLYPELLHDDSVTGSFGDPSVYAAELRGLRRARGDYSYERTWDRQVLTSSNRTVHTATSVARFDATEPGSVEPVSRFLRLRPDGYCNTLRAGTDSKRGAYTSPRPIHPVRPRVITVREAARLHSMPDWFRLHTTKWHGFRQVGNAVAPMVGRAVGARIVEALGVTPSVPTEVRPLGDANLLSLTMSEAADHFGVPHDVVGQRDRPSVAAGTG